MVGTVIWHNTSEAGRRAAHSLALRGLCQIAPVCSTDQDATDCIDGQLLFYHNDHVQQAQHFGQHASRFIPVCDVQQWENFQMVGNFTINKPRTTIVAAHDVIYCQSCLVTRLRDNDVSLNDSYYEFINVCFIFGSLDAYKNLTVVGAGIMHGFGTDLIENLAISLGENHNQVN